MGKVATTDAWQALRTLTPARIALGRTGAALPTDEVLRFGLAHARARDAVHLPLDAARLAADLAAAGFASLRVHSAAADRVTYLLRPDLGRRLPPDGCALLEARSWSVPAGSSSVSANPSSVSANPSSVSANPASVSANPASVSANPASVSANPASVSAGSPSFSARPSSGATRSPPNVTGADPDLCFVLADGLSARAVQAHAVPLLAAFRAVAGERWTQTPVVIAEQARVALGDEIGERLGARLVAVLIGERPGLSSPDSLGIYLTHGPRVGRTDAERNCISNIRPEGLPVDAAARRLAWLVEAALRLGTTGVALKDQSDEREIDDDPMANLRPDR